MNKTASTASIALDNVSVSFPIYQVGSRSLKKSLLHMGSRGRIARDATDRIVVEALRGVTLKFDVGDRVALIGSNGAGKTTLLRVMAGIYEPVAGSIRVSGRVSPMFDIGLGIDMEVSGIENIRMRGLILGMSEAELQERMADIIEFTELGDYLELPLRTYSSGMLTRLTFAVATCFKPEVLLMDEWISAGDASFMLKAEKRVEQFVKHSSILVLATHSDDVVREWCNKAVWMHGGEVKAQGDVEEILNAYEQYSTAA